MRTEHNANDVPKCANDDERNGERGKESMMMKKQNDAQRLTIVFLSFVFDREGKSERGNKTK